MVDFRKKLKSARSSRHLDPLEIYETLDRASDKGPLRPAQKHVLRQWYEHHRSQRDIIVKLHTGQGKTLIGLLMQQSLLHEDISPAAYLCPNNFLVNQTVEQASQFGIATVTSDGDLPSEFLDGKAVLVTTVHKLFNGLTKFGLGPKSIDVGTIVVDDCHACIDTIKDACSIRLTTEDAPYSKIIDLFETDLQHQGSGRLADICNGDYDSTLAVPYWAWSTHVDAVTELLATYRTQVTSVKFGWPLLRDTLEMCQCVISGTGLEITPYDPPLALFGSFHQAKRRIFMSATVTDDAFLVRGLGLPTSVITSPLTYPKEKWCGEKMILLPSLISRELSKDEVLDRLCRVRNNSPFGTVGLVPSFNAAEDWSKRNSVVANPDTIESCVENLRAGDRDNPLCIVNRYDGVDLPDDSCRILIIDSKPSGSSISERYSESCRPDSKMIAQKVARTVEQGLGRSVRGEKDYCVVVLLGPDLVSAFRSADGRRFFSAQTQRQIEIGLDIANLAVEDISEGATPMDVFIGLVKQLLKRDEGWKEFYTEQMSEVPDESVDTELLRLFEIEAKAANKAEQRRFRDAAQIIQDLIDTNSLTDGERGWYLQEAARYLSYIDKADGRKLQAAAYSSNRYLLQPEDGVEITKLEPLAQKRSVAICGWIQQSTSHDDVMVRVESILTDLRFGVSPDRFEAALQMLGECIGYSSERPDKEWKEGPDNLWCTGPSRYVLFECKNKVESDREEIHKSETGQFNNAVGWFREQYAEVNLSRFLVIPTKTLGKGAAFIEEARIIRRRELKKMVSDVREFFTGLSKYDIKTLDTDELAKALAAHRMDADTLLNRSSVEVSRNRAKKKTKK